MNVCDKCDEECTTPYCPMCGNPIGSESLITLREHCKKHHRKWMLGVNRRVKEMAIVESKEPKKLYRYEEFLASAQRYENKWGSWCELLDDIVASSDYF